MCYVYVYVCRKSSEDGDAGSHDHQYVKKSSLSIMIIYSNKKKD